MVQPSPQRSGHLFQGRYKAILVDRGSYFLELARYIVLNPVRVLPQLSLVAQGAFIIALSVVVMRLWV